MKILHIDPDDIDNPLSGGGPVRTYEIYKRLATRHEITVLTPTFSGSTREKIRDGIRYIRLGRKIGDHGSSHHITFFFKLPKAVRSMEYDLLVEDFMPPMSATFNPLFTRRPMIASVQWFFARELSRQYKLPFFLGERYGIKLYRNFVVLTDSMRKHICSRKKSANCSVIANGVDARLFLNPVEFRDYILYLGRVDFEQKGVDLLLHAYAKIPVGERIPLYLAGHSYELDKVNKLISELQLDSWVSYLGKVGFEQKLELLSQSRFVCVPSRSETFGMVITEACALGKSVVLFDQAPMNEVASPVCVKVKPYDVTAYSLAMQKMLKTCNSTLTESIQTNRKWAQQYSWDQIAMQQEKFYQSVVGQAAL